MKVIAPLFAMLLCASCQSAEPAYETLSLRANGATLLVKCASGRVEIGLHQTDGQIQSYVNAIPVNKLPLKSRVQVRRANGNGTVIDKTAEKPVVFWMSERQRDRVEFIALQEIDLPFSFGCESFVVDLDYAEVAPEWPKPVRGMPYVRKAKRP